MTAPMLGQLQLTLLLGNIARENNTANILVEDRGSYTGLIRHNNSCPGARN